MSLYSKWISENRKNPHKSYYSYWKDDYTYIVGVYDKLTGLGVEKVSKVAEEYPINKTPEIMDDLRLYQE